MATCTLGILECRSIAAGMHAADAMLKAADVELARAQTTCPGKYLVYLTGEVSAVTAAVEAGEAAASGAAVTATVIARVDEAVAAALRGVRVPHDLEAAGIVECRSIPVTVEAADVAVKAADVSLMRLRLGAGIGGKGYFIVVGEVGAVGASVEAAAAVAGSAGKLVDTVVIPRPDDALFETFK